MVEAKEEYAKTRALSTSSVLADEKIAYKNYEKAKEDADKWHNVAANAMKADDEAAARKALENEAESRAEAERLLKIYNTCKAAAAKLLLEVQRGTSERDYNPSFRPGC